MANLIYKEKEIKMYQHFQTRSSENQRGFHSNPTPNSLHWNTSYYVTFETITKFLYKLWLLIYVWWISNDTLFMKWKVKTHLKYYTNKQRSKWRLGTISSVNISFYEIEIGVFLYTKTQPYEPPFGKDIATQAMGMSCLFVWFADFGYYNCLLCKILPTFSIFPVILCHQQVLRWYYFWVLYSAGKYHIAKIRKKYTNIQFMNTFMISRS